MVTPSAEVNLTALRITSRFESGVLAFVVAVEAEAGLDETGRAGALANRGGSAGSAEGKRLEVVVEALEIVDPAEANDEAVAVLAADEVAEVAYGCPAYETACPAKGGLAFVVAAAAPPPPLTGAGTEELLAFRCPLP